MKVDENLLQEGAAELGFEQRDTSNLPASLKVALSNRFSQKQINTWQQDLRLALNSVEPFFFAGSFVFPAVLRLRTNGTSLRGIATSMTPARLRGHYAFVVKDAVWPALALCECSEGSTPGMLVFGLRDSQRKSLLDFQSGMFDLRLEMVDVKLAGSGPPVSLKAWCFVWSKKPSHLVPLVQARWSLTRFMDTSFYQGLAGRAEHEEEVLAEHVSYINCTPRLGGEVVQDYQPSHDSEPPRRNSFAGAIRERYDEERTEERTRRPKKRAHLIYAIPEHNTSLPPDGTARQEDGVCRCGGFPAA